MTSLQLLFELLHHLQLLLTSFLGITGGEGFLGYKVGYGLLNGCCGLRLYRCFSLVGSLGFLLGSLSGSGFCSQLCLGFATTTLGLFCSCFFSSRLRSLGFGFRNGLIAEQRGCLHLLALLDIIEVLAILAIYGIDAARIFLLNTCSLLLGSFSTGGTVLSGLIENGIDNAFKRVVLLHLNTQFICNTH